MACFDRILSSDVDIEYRTGPACDVSGVEEEAEEDPLPSLMFVIR